MDNKYDKFSDDQPPPYNAVHPPPQQYQTAPQVVAGPAPPGGYIIHGNQAVPTVITGQPQVVYMTAPQIPEHEAPDHLVMAILVTVCCCLPLGIIAVIKSTECRSARARGDRANAIENSRQAKKFSLIGLGVGIGIIVLVLALYGIVIGLAFSQQSHYG